VVREEHQVFIACKIAQNSDLAQNVITYSGCMNDMCTGKLLSQKITFNEHHNVEFYKCSLHYAKHHEELMYNSMPSR